jgi:hypothetical protein
VPSENFKTTKAVPSASGILSPTTAMLVSRSLANFRSKAFAAGVPAEPWSFAVFHRSTLAAMGHRTADLRCPLNVRFSPKRRKRYAGQCDAQGQPSTCPRLPEGSAQKIRRATRTDALNTRMYPSMASGTKVSGTWAVAALMR